MQGMIEGRQAVAAAYALLLLIGGFVRYRFGKRLIRFREIAGTHGLIRVLVEPALIILEGLQAFSAIFGHHPRQRARR